MEPGRFSFTLEAFQGSVTNPVLQGSLQSLAAYLGRTPELLKWDEQHVAVPLNVEVVLPPRGTYGDLDIREQEPVLVVLHLTDYPTRPPRVHTDRLDFPKDQLAHLYVASQGRPPAFCLVRGDFGEWYADKRLRDVAVRVQNWLRDAASGELTQNGQQFDPLRLEGYRGTCIYPYDLLGEVVQQRASYLPGGTFALALFENTSHDDDVPSFKLERILTPDTMDDAMLLYRRYLAAFIKGESFLVKKYCFGYILWSADTTSYTEYRVDLPRIWSAFREFCASFGLGVDELEQFLATDDPNVLFRFPVICALNRPRPLIGFSGHWEFVNFYLTVKSDDKQDGRLASGVPVHFQAHNEPLTRQKAAAISGLDGAVMPSSWVAGCGALGSKVVLHLARNGQTDMLLLDNDKLSPHNLARHALLAEQEGKNKAVGLASAIKNMYRFEKTPELQGLPFAAEHVFSLLSNDEFVKPGHLYDFTASTAFMQTLVATPHLAETVIYRGVISDRGQLGVLSVEGPQRNPRIDDLQAMLYACYTQHPSVEAWLEREAAQAQGDATLVNIGVGCNSETTVLSDELIAAHAAYFARVLKQIVPAERATHGQVYLHHLTTDDGFASVRTERLLVEPMVIMTAVNDPEWSIRMAPPVLRAVKQQMQEAMPHETGGIFLGRANHKSKTIHVVDLVSAPPDSESNSYCFYRGVQGLPEKVDEVHKRTGHQLGYIGEWHTHPLGPNHMSATDRESVRRFKDELSALPSPLPVFLLISTPTAVLPFVY